MSFAKSLYRRLPVSVRSVAATIQGLQLHWWRYGAAADRAAADALGREHWSHERWIAWRQERLAQALDHAATRVPYYVGIVFEHVRQIPRTNAGKFRLVQCELPAEQREALLSLRQAS